MFQFQPYDPARPRMVTSFKGNQKLIFEGYRYNIHHIVPTKGVKTWRCVCAKKLTSARSWCKGRAETWDNDSHGISKESITTQLNMKWLNWILNELIDDAATFMSEGVSFGSRESLKKSLTVARKSAENGGFKLKCYKNSDPAVAAISKAQKQAKINGNDLFPTDLKMFEGNGTMLSLLSLARQCQGNGQDSQQSSGQENGSSSAAAAAAAAILLNNANCSEDPSLDLMNSHEQSTSSSNCSSSSILNQHFASAAANAISAAQRANGNGADPSNCSDASSTDFLLDSSSAMDLMIDVVGSPPPAKMARVDGEASLASSSAASTPAREANDSGCYSASTGNTGSNCRRRNAASSSSDIMMSNQMRPGSTTPLSSSNNQQQDQKGNLMQLQKKTARINNIFNKLSQQAAAAASSSPTPPPTSISNTSSSMPMNNNAFCNFNPQTHNFSMPFANLFQQQQHHHQMKQSIKSMTVREGLKNLQKQKAHNNLAGLNNGFNLTKSVSNSNKRSMQSRLVSTETQTEPTDHIANGHIKEEDIELEGIRPSVCLGSAGCATSVQNVSTTPCGCRIIKVCCCSEETCTKRRPSLASSSSLASVEK
uniref:FLYWCH-type domain-containing protein n=1 Tax=Ditylenchus dipsaci TaxID=166011 RepID=A0A915DUN5_9BILA